MHKRSSRYCSARALQQPCPCAALRRTCARDGLRNVPFCCAITAANNREKKRRKVNVPTYVSRMFIGLSFLLFFAPIVSHVCLYTNFSPVLLSALTLYPAIVAVAAAPDPALRWTIGQREHNHRHRPCPAPCTTKKKQKKKKATNAPRSHGRRPPTFESSISL